MSIFKAWANFDACPGQNDVQTGKCATKWNASYGYGYGFGFGTYTTEEWKITASTNAPVWNENISVPLSAVDKDFRKIIQDLVAQMHSEEQKVKDEAALDTIFSFSEGTVEAPLPDVPVFPTEAQANAMLHMVTPIIECLYCNQPGAQRWAQYDEADFVFAEHPLFPYDQGTCPGSGLRKNELRLQCSHCPQSFVVAPENGVNDPTHTLPYHGSAPDQHLCPGSGCVVGPF